MKLTAKQELFAQLVAQGKSQADAYREAYGAKKMKEQSVWQRASQVAANVKVASRVAELKEHALKRHVLVVDDVLREVRRIAMSDPRKLFHADGTLKKITELDDDTAAALSSIEVNEIGTGDAVIGYTKKLKLWDKNSALANAIRVLGLNDDTLKVKKGECDGAAAALREKQAQIEAAMAIRRARERA